MYGTYEEWQSVGRAVNKGQSSFLRTPDTDRPLFHHSQTVLIEPQPCPVFDTPFDPDLTWINKYIRSKA